MAQYWTRDIESLTRVLYDDNNNKIMANYKTYCAKEENENKANNEQNISVRAIIDLNYYQMVDFIYYS